MEMCDIHQSQELKQRLFSFQEIIRSRKGNVGTGEIEGRNVRKVQSLMSMMLRVIQDVAAWTPWKRQLQMDFSCAFHVVLARVDH